MPQYPVMALAATMLGAARPAQAPTVCRYQIEYRGELNRIQISHLDVSHETIPIKALGVITMQLADTAGGRTVDLLVESINLIRLEGQPTVDMEKGEGSRWHGLLTPDGKLAGLTAPHLTPVLRPLDRYVRFFFPRRPGGTPPAAAWVDTTAWVTSQGRETGSDHIVTSYTPPRRERRGGTDVLVVAATWTGSRSGSVPAGPEEMSVQGSSTGRSESYYLSADACPLGGWRAGSSTQTSMAPAFAEPLTITNHDSMAVTRLP